MSWRVEPGARGVWTFWFDQPGRSENLLDLRAFDELASNLAEAARQPSLRAVVIRSAKEKGFCAGADLAAVQGFSTTELRAYLRHGLRVLEKLATMSVPTIAALHGLCKGGGLELALVCRHRVALATAAPLQLGMPEVDIGLVPAWGAINALPRLIGPADALDLLLSGRSIGYLSARSLGIVDRLASEGGSTDLHDLLQDRARERRTWPPDTWRAALEHARGDIDDEPGEHPEAQAEILRIMTVDMTEGPEAAAEAALESFASLAKRDDTRASIAASLRRLG
jgi:3-hydroxyacyl-CoA dehydrogenase/enoyl-CoA hydratase/3-hydroxybutyryl-CoA epimerase